MKIYDTLVNHLINPIGFAMDSTVFSWKVAQSAGTRQVCARIRIASDASMSRILTDTGWRENADSLGTEVQIALQPRQRYYWTVSVRDDAGGECTSKIQSFETGKLDEPWRGSWITCDNTDKRHPVFYKEITIRKPVVNARLYICGLGLYVAEIDGERAGDEYLTPYCNDYDQWVQAQTFDITTLLQDKSEKATLSVTLGNGWYKSRYGFDAFEDKGFYGDGWKLIAEVHLEYADGSAQVIGTDDSWQVGRSNITFSGIYDGEHRDDTLAASPLVPARLTGAPKGTLQDRRSLPVRIQQVLTPAELIHTPAGELVYDLGQEITGIFELRVDIPRGQQVRIQTGEVLQDGNFYNDNLRSARSEYIYTSGGEPVTITPMFTFYGFRYVKVTGVTDLTLEDFRALAFWSDIEDKGRIETGHNLLNKFVSNVRWGLRDNFVDVPTDCPQRDERMGWTGDAQVFTNAACYLTAPFAFYDKYLFDMKQEQEAAGGAVPVTIPSVGKNVYTSVWGDAACVMPWNLYVMSGDVTILKRQYGSMKAWVEYIRKVDGENHGWRRVFHFGDWLALDHPAGGAEQCMGGTDEGFIASIYYAASADILSRAAGILGKKQDAREYRELSCRQFDDVRYEYFTPSGRCAINTQTALILTLKYHLSSDPDGIKESLRKLFKYSKGKLRTGFVGTPLLCNVLSENDMNDLAYDLVLNEEYPGWLHEVKMGATTVWERWNSLLDDGKISGTSMNSLNHYAYGSMVEWLFRYAAGLNFTEDYVGCREVTVRPLPDKRLGYLQAEFDSPAGTWKSGWRIKDDGLAEINITVPFGCRAALILPDCTKSQVMLLPGEHHFTNVLL